MAGFVERVVIEVQARTNAAAADLKAMRGNIDEAHGAFGKTQAAANGLTSAVGKLVTGPESIMALGAAGAAFAMKGVQQFQDWALAAGEAADKTGLSTDAASRWLAVADDVGVTAETMTGGIQKFVQNMGKAPERFRELGITASDTNDAMLQAIDLLNRTPEGAQRAALGAEIFGKSWGNMSELVTTGAEGVQQALEDVSEQQVISDVELAKARKYRDAMDTLGDSVADLQAEMGERLVPALADAATGLAEIIRLSQLLDDADPDTSGWIEKIGENALKVTGPIGQVGAAFKEVWDQKNKLDEQDAQGKADRAAAAEAYNTLTRSATAAEHALGEVSDVQDDAAKSADDQAKAYDRLKESLDLVTGAVRDALGVDLSLEEAQEGIGEAIEARVTAQVDGAKAVADAAKASSADQVTAANEAAEANEAANRKVLKSAEDLGKAEVDKAKQIAASKGETIDAATENELLAASYDRTAAKLAPGDPLRQRLEGYAKQLRDTPTAVDTTITANTAQAQAQMQALWAKINEARVAADLLEAQLKGTQGVARSWVLGAGPTTTNVTVNVPPTLNPAKVVAAVGAGQSRNGGLRRA